MAKEYSGVKLDVTFTKASTRENIISAENIALSFGKLAKWYTDFAWSAWTAPTVEVTGTGNAITTASYGTGTNANKLTLTKGSTFLTQHPTIPTQTDTTSTASPVFGGTFTAVDSVTRDSNGHVLKINTKTVTVPNATMGAASADAAGTIGLVPAPAAGKQSSFLRGDGTWVVPSNTDTKVTQNVSSADKNYPVLLSYYENTDDTTTAQTVNRVNTIYANPNSGYLWTKALQSPTWGTAPTSSAPSSASFTLSDIGLYFRSRYLSENGTSYDYSRPVLRTYKGKHSNSGMVVSLDSGGLTIVGGGESATSLAGLISEDQHSTSTTPTTLDVGGTLNTAFNGSAEQLILSADGNIYFLTNCGAVANRKPVCLDTSLYFYPGTNETGSIGTSSYKWGNGYFKTINIGTANITTGNITTGNITTLNATKSNGIAKVGYVAFPEDGTLLYNEGGSSVTGAIVITTPFSKTIHSVMLKFTVDIYDYQSNKSIEYKVSGYAYTDGKWYCVTAHNVAAPLYGQQGTDSSETGYEDLAVRFGYVTNGNYQIQIGETTTVWKWPNIVIRDILVGHVRATEADIPNVKSGWSITIQSSEDIANITQTISHTRPYYPTTTVSGSVDADTYLKYDGIIRWNTTTGTNMPTTNYGLLICKAGPAVQVFIPDNASGMYFRRKASTSGATPTAWWGFTGTAGNTYNLNNFINTGSVGTGLSWDSTNSKLNHSNSVTAVSTAALLKVKYDAQGHITGSSVATSSDLPAHTHYEQDVKFDTSYNYRPIDGTVFPLVPQCLINTMRTNRFAFLPASSITVQHSTDSGSNYTDSGYSDEAKCSTFISRHAGQIKVGPNTSAERTTSMRTMVTITRDSRYTRINRFYIWFSTSGHTVYVDIQYATNAADTTWVDWRTNVLLAGWSGPNLINGPTIAFGANNDHAKKIRFIFRYTSIRSDYKTQPSQVYEIAAYSDHATWTPTNNLMMNDHLYYWNYQQQAFFPAEIKVPTQLRIHNGNYGALFRNDGAYTYILLTDSGSALNGDWNSLRPLHINNATGLAIMNEGLKINTKDGAFLELHGGTVTTKEYGCAAPKIRFTNSDSSQNAELIWDDKDGYCNPAALSLIGNQAGTYFIAPRIRLDSSSTTQALLDFNDANDKGAYLRYSTSTRGYGNIIAMLPYNADGIGVVFNHTGGGYCCIGAGESPSNFTAAVMSTDKNPYGTDAWLYGSEQMCITADNSIYFVSGANGLNTTNHTDWTHLKTALFDTNGYFRPSVDNKGQIGASNFKWNAMYATTFKGDLNGTINTATTATTQTKGNNSTKVATTAFVQTAIGDYIPLAGSSAISGDLKMNVTNKGFWLVDTAGNSYPGMKDNNANLWIGAADSNSPHHVGIVCIAAGYNSASSKGNLSINIYAPNAANTKGAATWTVHHTGNLLAGTGLQKDSAASTSYNGSVWTINHSNSVTAGTAKGDDSKTLTFGGTFTIPSITYDAQGHITAKGTTTMTMPADPNKYAFVVDETSDFASYAWHKFAEITLSDAYADAIVTFLVSKTWGQLAKETGILTAHIRTGSTKVFDSAQFNWLVAGDTINPADFVMVYTNTASTSCKVELWHKQTVRYDGWIFKVLKEHSRAKYGTYLWTLFVHSGHGSATYTAGTGTIVSSLNTIANTAASSDKINTDAGNANTPVYFSGGIPVAVTLPKSGAWWSSEPHIDSSGVLEIGRYIDFHATNASTNNYDVRLDASSTSLITLSSSSGTPAFRISGTLPRLRFTQTTSGKEVDNENTGIWCQPADTYGVNMFMQSTGNLMIGSGEFCTGAYARKDSTGATQVGYDNIVGSPGEKLYLGSDTEVQIISNGQNIATYSNNNHKVWKFGTDGTLLDPKGLVVTGMDKNSTSYWGMFDGDGVSNNWIRTTTYGFIPYQSGGLTSPHSALGTSTWSFSDVWSQKIHGVNLDVYNSAATYKHTITSIASANRTVTLPNTNCTVGTGFFYVLGTQNAKTKMWTGNLPIPQLYDGLTIAFYLPYDVVTSQNSTVWDASSNTNVWLQLTLSNGQTTDWVPCYWTNQSRLTTHFSSGSTVLLTYWSTPKINGANAAAPVSKQEGGQTVYWPSIARWTRADYNSNSDTKVNVTLGTTTKAYLLGTSTTPTSTATAVTTIADTGVYLDTTAGMITAATFNGAATKLSTNAGSEIRPVYFTNGVPTNCAATYGSVTGYGYTSSKPYYKIAETIDIESSLTQYRICFLVSRRKTGDSTMGASYGILCVHFETGTTNGSFGTGSAKWLAVENDFDVSNVSVVCHTISASKFKMELWIKLSNSNDVVIVKSLDVLGFSYAANYKVWSFIGNPTAASSTGGYQTLETKIPVLQNNAGGGQKLLYNGSITISATGNQLSITNLDHYQTLLVEVWHGTAGKSFRFICPVQYVLAQTPELVAFQTSDQLTSSNLSSGNVKVKMTTTSITLLIAVSGYSGTTATVRIYSI